MRLTLDDEAFERKLAALSRYQGLAGEAAAAFETLREGCFSYRVSETGRGRSAPAVTPMGAVPRGGRRRAGPGRHLRASVLTYAAHVKPIIETLFTPELRCGQPSSF